MRRFHAHYATEGGDPEALIGRYGHLIERLARRIAARTGLAVLEDDLWSAGAVGLLEAADRFDPGRDIRFESFAEHRIRGAMIDELRRLDHLPRRLREEVDRLGKAQESLRLRLGREPTLDELAGELGREATGLSELEALGHPPLPLKEDLPGASDEIPADQRLIEIEDRARVAAAIGELPERLQLLMSLHYVEGLTHREIAGILEVSEARISQLHREAVRRLREALAGEE